jgi:coenzyme F420 hydrogenase subunit delta
MSVWAYVCIYAPHLRPEAFSASGLRERYLHIPTSNKLLVVILYICGVNRVLTIPDYIFIILSKESYIIDNIETVKSHILARFTLMAAKSLILGCGNIFRGDDGFGPRVAEYIVRERLTDENSIEVLDVGLGVSRVLLDILSDEKKPKKIILVDALHQTGRAGEVKILSLNDIPSVEGRSPSHSFPNKEMLAKLEEMGVKISIVACVAEYLPDEVSVMMSKEVEKAIPKAAVLAVELASDP